MKANTDRWPHVAVLLAAGSGRRLRPLTDATPKCLLYVGNRPLIDYALDALGAAAISHVDIVVNHLADQIREHVSSRSREQLIASFSRQDQISGTADAVSASKQNVCAHVPTDYLLIGATDYAYPPEYIRELCKFHESHQSDITVSLRPITPDHAPSSSVAITSPDGRLARIVEKPTIAPPAPIVAASLLYVVPLSIYDYIDRTFISPRGERELPNTINTMIAAGITARGFLQDALETLDNVSVKVTTTRTN